MTKKFNAKDLRDFYFSKASNYSTFSSVSSFKTSGICSPNTSVGAVDAAEGSSPTMNSSAEGCINITVAAPLNLAAGSALAIARNDNNNTVSSPPSVVLVGESDAVSVNYIEFLKRQQQLIKIHNAIDVILEKVCQTAKETEGNEAKAMHEALELLHKTEESTDWNWKNKFTQDALTRDAELELPHSKLLSVEIEPVVGPAKQQRDILLGLKQTYCCIKAADGVGGAVAAATAGGGGKPDISIIDKNNNINSNPQSSVTSTGCKSSILAEELKPVIENSVRRFEHLIKEFTSSQMDSGILVRVTDNVVAQLDYLLSHKSLKDLLLEIDRKIKIIEVSYTDCAICRDRAYEDGVMNIAERESKRLASLGEEFCNAVVEKIRLLQQVVDVIDANIKLQKEYKIADGEKLESMRKEYEGLKIVSERDLARIYVMKQKIDDIERNFLERTKKERAESDLRLKEIAQEKAEAWKQVVNLLTLIERLEADRHTEMKRRVDEKVKDEQRHMEYCAFSRIADKRVNDLDLTIKNCDTMAHCTALVKDLLHAGFLAVEQGCAKFSDIFEGALLDSQKSYLERNRNLILTLGDMEYRKSRKVHELTEKIQEAHIQQEMCSDSLNVQAKRYTELKKKYICERDALQIEFEELVIREDAAAAQFELTGQALTRANVPFKHPVDELEDYRLNTRAKMLEYKAMTLGCESSKPVRAELEGLKHVLRETNKIIGGAAVAAEETKGKKRSIREMGVIFDY